MVKKKYISKRVTLKDKYKIQRRVVEHNRKKRKQAKKDIKNGVIKHKKKDPGIPNSWPFKAQLLDEIARAKEQEESIIETRKQRQRQEQQKNTRTIADVMADAAASRAAFESQNSQSPGTDTAGTDDVAHGEQSRRAYLRELKKVIDDADIILQVLDARDPIGTRISSGMEDSILCHPDKKMVLVLNKVDLIPKTAIQGWLSYLRRSHPTVPVKAGISCNKSVGSGSSDNLLTTSNAVGMEGLLQLLKNYARNGSDGKASKTCVTVGIVGYPNVGKSSIINSLKRCRAVGVSSRPGFTTAMQEVVLDKTVRLLDSPGVVFEDDADVLLKNCITVDSVTDPHSAIESLIKRCSMETIMMTYALPRFTTADMFLAMIAKKFGQIKKRGIPDKVAAGKLVLRDWNSGKIPYFTPPPTQNEQITNVDKGQAQIVSKFGKTFEICDSLIHTLEEKDELDFVKLENAQRSSKNVLDENEQMDTDESDADNDHMDSEKVQGVPIVTNDKVKDAEDFDFAMM
mmetsp:Transcript_12597/g.15864  ORF Transcript_12597/g.15864 Transcript_12597/m.15864 type:complete len:514 (+) Transcript_12597:113-1654(+)|eukprot:CAMPEP_0172509542 /NCGR_PEP_ID=MMETSP1066-20121228/221168_1 /TAXON_ID=671091 /ORGANISM="Coscinodiscus wailesii, Strain CCMP2513" /LENGTH=513 /DNA_ID=CAMNT_0013288079 /DNA_START=91 /DNA_END=1632 /DNA_ORIENTATION=+